MLLFSARRGRPQHERSQRLRKQIVRYSLFWMGADDRVSEKNQTRAGHMYHEALYCGSLGLREHLVWLEHTQFPQISEIGHLRESRMLESDEMFVQTKRATVSMSRDKYDQPECESVAEGGDPVLRGGAGGRSPPAPFPMFL